MNKFLEKYEEERKAGRNQYESLGFAAAQIAVRGTYDDLLIVYNYQWDDLYEEAIDYIGRLKQSPRVTAEEFAMKDSGHKLSDFE
ncbi:hypothetical protein [Virgibacillus salexigens]|uniref:hypothetical protein n=1 Tax=Virgibacillus salexigens TaxID=61016 RepID=UPI003081CB62